MGHMLDTPLQSSTHVVLIMCTGNIASTPEDPLDYSLGIRLSKDGLKDSGDLNSITFAAENNDGETDHIKDMCCVVAVSLLSSLI